MTQLYFLLFLLVALPNDLDGAACHDGWINYQDGNKCYELFSEKKSWNEAKIACEQEKAKLAELKDSNSNDFVQANFRTKAWVGAHRCGGGVTCFLNNKYVPYTPYASDEPDMNSDQKSTNQTATDLKENDFAILIQTDGRWADELKNNTYPYICERLADVDECSDKAKNTCDQNAHCNNIDGSYVCQCKSGYAGDGKNCSVHVLDSVILKSEPQEFTGKLGVWLPKTGNWTTCWRASRDGWNVTTTFHPNCDGKKPTLTVVKVEKDNKDYIFGGYATNTWDAVKGLTDDWTSAPGSFLFSLRNNDNLPPFKAPLKNKNDGNAILRYYRIGPAFGRGHDFRIFNNANTNTLSYTNFGWTYQAPSGYSNSYSSKNPANNLLAGSHHFTPSEVEVLYLPA